MSRHGNNDNYFVKKIYEVFKKILILYILVKTMF